MTPGMLKGFGLRKRPFVRRVLSAFNPTHTRVDGKAFHLDREDYVVSRLIARGSYEPLESAFIKKVVTPESIFLDVGANIGYYSFLALARGARVFAFEPNPRSFAVLKKNIGGDSRATLFQCAASDRAGTADLYLNDFNGGDNRLYEKAGMKKIEVELDTIDHLVPAGTRIDVIKMDIQGAEGVALKGARRVLDENPDLVLIFELRPSSMNVFGTSITDVLAMLPGMRYFIIDEDRGTVTAASEQEIVKATEEPGFFMANVIASRRGDIETFL